MIEVYIPEQPRILSWKNFFIFVNTEKLRDNYSPFWKRISIDESVLGHAMLKIEG